MSCINAALLAASSLAGSDCWLEQLAYQTYQQAAERFQQQLVPPTGTRGPTTLATPVFLEQVNTLHRPICGGVIPVIPIEERQDIHYYTLTLETGRAAYRPLDQLIQYYQEWPDYRVVAYVQ